MAESTEHLVVFGIHPVEEFLKNQPDKARKLFVRDGRKHLKKLIDLAQKSDIPVQVLKGEDFGRLERGKRSQGVILLTTPFEYSDLEDIGIQGHDLLVALDLVKDPQNLGSLLRSAAFFGVKAMIIPKDRSVGVTSSVVKTSAGALFRLPVCRVTNLARTLRTLKEKGIWVVGADSNGGEPIEALDVPKPTVLVLGEEGAGLRHNIKKNCDFLVKIPTFTGFDSLNVAVAGGILIHELSKNR